MGHRYICLIFSIPVFQCVILFKIIFPLLSAKRIMIYHPNSLPRS